MSSDHSFPFHLQKFGLNLSDIEKNIYAGEICPDNTYKLLTMEWKIGTFLAKALIDQYGGHIFDINKALKLLVDVGERFPGTLKALDISNVQKCLKWSGGDGTDKVELKKRMRSTLHQLAEKGFVPTVGDTFEDPVEEVISQYNVGGVVTRESLVVGLRDDAWKETEVRTALIPSKQSIRLVIAYVLKVSNQN